jgi:hypothetical protein
MAVISTVAKFLPIGGNSLNNLADLYRFRATWNATVSTIALFEGTVYNIMQPNGLYTQVLVSAKLASLTEFPSHIYSTGHFFRIVESMLSLVTDWKTHMGTLKKSNQWEAIKDLVEGMSSGNDKLEGTFGEEEMDHLQESVNGVFNDDVDLTNLIRFYVNLLILKALYFKVCPTSGKLLKKTCLEKGDHILNGQSVEDVLHRDLLNNSKVKGKYESGLMRRVNLEKYMEDRVIRPFTETLSKTHSEKGYSLETGLHLPQGSYNMAAKDLLKTYVEPRLKSLRTEIIRLKKKLKQDKKVKAKKTGPDMMEKAKKFLIKAKSMPESLKNGFHRLYLMTMLEQYQGPCTATFEEYSMTVNTLLLEINYEMWQGQTEMSGKKGYKEWIAKTRSLVDNMRSCMTEPIEEDDLVKRAEKEGFGCVMMDAIHDSLQNMGYSPGFTDILTRHVRTVTQHRISTGHKEGAFNTHECVGLRRVRCRDGKCVEKAPECFTNKSSSVKSSSASSVKSSSASSASSGKSSSASSGKSSSASSGKSSSASSGKSSSASSGKSSSASISLKRGGSSTDESISTGESVTDILNLSDDEVSSDLLGGSFVSRSENTEQESDSESEETSQQDSDSNQDSESEETSQQDSDSNEDSESEETSQQDSDSDSESEETSQQDSDSDSESEETSQQDSDSDSESEETSQQDSDSDSESEETSQQDSDSDSESEETSQQDSDMNEDSEETSQQESDSDSDDTSTVTLTDTQDGSSITEVETITSEPSESYTSTFVVQSGGKSMSGTSSLGLSFESTFFGSSYSDSLKWDNQRYLFLD